MATIQTFGIDDTLATLRSEWLYTLARLLKSPHTEAFVPKFRAVGAMLDAALKTQTELEDASIIAAAGRDAADDALDPLVMQIINALLLVTKNNRDDPLFVSYTANQTPAEIVRPVLGAELTTVAGWVEPLKKEDDAILQTLGAQLEEAVAAGQRAEKEVAAADKALSDFRLTGERKKAVDALNAARGSLLGSLIKFQHDNPQLRLPADWATGFFRHTTKGGKYGTTMAQAEQILAKLSEQMTAAQANMAELKQKAAAYEEAKAKRAQARLDLAAVKQAEKEKKKQEKALKAEADKKLKK
ncbi:MAG TPA: hypothetical protein VH877_09630 [Polyangia bacterium]|nr:hypothetical protein [Polyangia bacterium]